MKKQRKNPFILESFNMTRKLAFAHSGEHGKISISRNLLSIQNEAIWPLFAMHSKELWLVQENHATVKLESKITSCGLKTYSKSRIEQCNQKIFKKMQESQYAQKNCSCSQHSIQVLNERSISEGKNFCPLWLVILKSVWYTL